MLLVNGHKGPSNVDKPLNTGLGREMWAFLGLRGIRNTIF